MRPTRMPLVFLLVGLAVLGLILAALAQGAGAPWPPPPIKPPAASVPFRELPPRSALIQTNHSLPAPERTPRMVPVRDLPDSKPPGLEDAEAVIPAQGLEKIEGTGPDLAPPAPVRPQSDVQRPAIDPKLDPKPAPIRPDAAPAQPIIDPKPVPERPDGAPREGFLIETEPVEPLMEPLKTEADAPKLIQIPETGTLPEPAKSIEVNLLPEPARPAGQNKGPDVLLFPELSKTPTPLKIQSPARKLEPEAPLFNPPPAAPLPKPVPLSSAPQPALPAPPMRTAVPIRRAPRPEPTREFVSKSLSPAEARGAGADPIRPKSPGPMLALEKRGPTSVTMGQPLRYEIIVHNLGSEVAPQVRVEDDLSEGLRYLDGSPQPVLQDGKVVWNLDQLAPGAKQHLYLDAQAAASGEVICHTSVSLYGGLTTTIAPPVLELDVIGPGRVGAGKKAVFDIRMKNVAGQRLSGLTLQAAIPVGLRHPQGTTIEADIGDLEPGASRNIQLTVETVQGGRHVLEARVRSGDSQEAVAQGSVFVGETGLSLQLGATTHAALDRECDLLIELANSNPQAVRNIAITDTLPEGLEFVAASDRGMYRSVTRSVHWVLDYLPPGQSQTLRLRVRPRTVAAHVHQVVAQSQDGAKAQAEGSVAVQGQARLTMKITDRDDPLQVGRETVYEIRVMNEGTSADAGVEVRANFADGLLPRSAQAPVQYRLEGQSVVFEPLARLDGQKQAIYRISVQAQSPGDRRMSATVSSQQLTSPLVREERTWVFRQ